MEAGDIVFGATAKIENRHGLNLESHLSTHASQPAEDDNGAGRAANPDATSTAGRYNCSVVQSERVSFVPAHLLHLTPFQDDDQIMDLDNVETGDVVLRLKACAEEGYSSNPEFCLQTNTFLPTPTYDDNGAASDIQNLNNMPATDRESHCDVHLEPASFIHHPSRPISCLSRVTIELWTSTAWRSKTSFLWQNQRLGRAAVRTLSFTCRPMLLCSQKVTTQATRTVTPRR